MPLTIDEMLVKQIQHNLTLKAENARLDSAVEQMHARAERREAEHTRRCQLLHKDFDLREAAAIQRTKTGFDKKHKVLILSEKQLRAALKSATKSTIDFGDMELRLTCGDVVFTNKSNGEDFNVPEVQFKSFIENLAYVINNAYFDDET